MLLLHHGRNPAVEAVGVEPTSSRLRGGASPTSATLPFSISHRQKRTGRGSLYPRPARLPRDGAEGYPLVSSAQLTTHDRAERLRDDSGGRQAKFMARVPEGHGGKLEGVPFGFGASACARGTLDRRGTTSPVRTESEFFPEIWWVMDGDYESPMRRALELAARGRGFVEPNPMVGAVVLDAAGRVVGEGWHERFGGPHAEVDALRSGRGEGPRRDAGRHAGAVLPPRQDAALHRRRAARPACARRRGDGRPVPEGRRRRAGDPSRRAGWRCRVGVCEREAQRLNAPYLKLLRTGRPWVHAKWAMTLDGKIATRTGDSKWISGEESRRRVHELRGRVDAVLVGRGTVVADDPLLTARPPGPRVAGAGGGDGVRRPARTVPASRHRPRGSGDRLHRGGERGQARRVGRGRCGGGQPFPE